MSGGGAKFLIGAAVLTLACGRNGPPKSNESARDDSVAASAAPVVSVSPPASSETAATSEDDVCTRLRGGLSFAECNNPPRTKDYPDCRTFAVEQSDSGCPARELVLNITGYPGLAEKFRLQPSRVAGSKTSLALTLVRIDAQTRGANLAPGKVVAVLQIDVDKPARLIVGESLRVFTGKKSIVEEVTDAVVPAAKGGSGPIPVGNGDVVNGL